MAGSRDSRHGTVKTFLKWCVAQGHCEENPFESIARPKSLPELRICSPEQVAQLIRYMKNPRVDPADALMIAMSLFWGFGRRELVYSTFTSEGDSITVKVYQRPGSYAHRSKTRRDSFTLPIKPKWFSDLQVRFLKDRATRFRKLDWPREKRALFPLSSGIYNRPMTRAMIAERIARATTEATGIAISSEVLRCTAGHLNTDGTDASLLTQLGWALPSAFRYTWVPRKFHS